MNPQRQSQVRLPRPNRLRASHLLHGLTGRRLVWALLISAVVAFVGTSVGAWPTIEHAMVSSQLVGLSIMLCWTIASNLRLPWLPPLGTQMLSVVVGSALGTALVILFKGFFFSGEFERLPWDVHGLILLMVLGFILGAFVILTAIAREREMRARAAMHEAEAERHLHGKQLLEARLQLMQAQIEPHFLFNTLASVQHLVETEPPAASRMLGDLIKYLRAAMPQMREQGTTLGREAELAQAYLSIQRLRTGSRFEFNIDVPESLRQEPFPPMMLLTLVENAVKHGFEKHGGPGEIRVAANAADTDLELTVLDTGPGLRADSPDGVGLTNVRERLAALYGDAGRLILEQNTPTGVRARIVVPRKKAEGIVEADAPSGPATAGR
jgi:sensor histidine kinase YesM